MNVDKEVLYIIGVVILEVVIDNSIKEVRDDIGKDLDSDDENEEDNSYEKIEDDFNVEDFDEKKDVDNVVIHVFSIKDRIFLIY